MGHGNLVSVCVSYARIKTCTQQNRAALETATQAHLRAVLAIYFMAAQARRNRAQTGWNRAGKGRES